MKNGYVAITGKPNVGKSTFINALLDKNVSIVSPKPQTTRNQIHSVYNDKNIKIRFIDTPGWHEPNCKLDLFLNSEIKNSYKLADVVLFFIDLSRPIDEEDEQIIKILSEYKINNILVVFTKYDISSDRKVNLYLEQLKSKLNFVDYIFISSKSKLNFDSLLKKVESLLVDNKPIDEVYENDNFMISEIIRQQIIFNTKQELPYATAVYIESNNYDSVSKLLTIQAIILVEKESQKPIIIGKGGSMIKKIGTNARKELLNIFATKINLKLFVKVKSEWRNNEKILTEIGYSNKK